MLVIGSWLGATLAAQSVTLEWDPNSEPDLAGYNVYRSLRSGTGYVKLNGFLIRNTTYTDSTISYGTTYYYVATAVNAAGLESGYSNQISYVAVPPQRPPAAQDDFVTIFEDNVATISVLANDSDPDSDPLQVVAVAKPSVGTATFTATSVTYTPPPNWWGSVSFAYTVSDGRGGEASATIFVTVTGVNDPPRAVADAATVDSGQSVTISVLANDHDADGDSLLLVSVSQPAHGATEIVGSSVRYTSTPGYTGSDRFSYTVGDGKGAEATAEVTVDVLPANEPPVAENDQGSVPEDGSVVLNVTQNDHDPNGDGLTVTSVSRPAHGTAEVVSASSVRYRPAPNYFGSDSFTYTVSDGRGGTATATVTVSVTPVNDPPRASTDSFTVAEDGSAEVDVLANDSDPDGDTLTVSWVGNPAHGTAAVVSGGKIRYTPAPDYHGSDTFRYTVSDGNGGSATTTVFVTVTPVADPPEPVDDYVTATLNTPVEVDVLSNDDDADGDSLQLVSIGMPEHGTAEVLEGGLVRYTPEFGYIGTDAFTYRVSDGGLAAEATVRVTVMTSGELTPKALVFPALVDTGAARWFQNTFVGLGLVNSGPMIESLVVESRTRSGVRLTREDWIDRLAPRAQVAALTNEVPGYRSDATALAVEDMAGGTQGFFMVGDYSLRRLDGVGAGLEAAEGLLFPIVREDNKSSTLIQLINPSKSETVWLGLYLYEVSGRLVRKISAAIAPRGSFMGTIQEIFGSKYTLSEGYVTVRADLPVQGFEVVASQDSLMASMGSASRVVDRLYSPHFFVDRQGGETTLQLISQEKEVVSAVVEVHEDSGETLVEIPVTLEPGQKRLLSGLELVQAAGLRRKQDFSGTVTIRLDRPGAVLGGSVFRNGTGKSETYVPFQHEGYEETVFSQVAQTRSSMFTGLAVLNPLEEPISVDVLVFDESGRQVRATSFVLDPGSRRVGLLSDPEFFGPDFEQVTGHLRVLSSRPAVSYAIFGDHKGEYLSTIQGQPALR
ncbi:MAG TPA: Ig-like domain-containing protein [Acidobacteriota bacterium]|nr:Ig-like domain-containing protein [Acidobacteriota bacterium]